MRDGSAGSPEDATQTVGVPLGGIGAGCIEMGRDGRFRNLTINNNRTADTRIEVSAGSFLAVRAARRGRVTVRLLQTDSAVPFHEAGIVAPYCSTGQLSWRGLYPCAYYRLDGAGFPLDVRWTAMAPVIPYDHAASTLPVVFFSFNVSNQTDAPYDVSCLFNWENVCGCTRNHFPDHRGPMRAVFVEEERPAKAKKEQRDSPDEPRMVLAGIEFGFRGEYRTNAEGNACLMIAQRTGQSVTSMGWNERDPRELEVFWNQFHDVGALGNKLSRSPVSHSGAVCASFALDAFKSETVVFILAWYAPRFEVNGKDLGNGYANHFPNATEVAKQALVHHKYYFKSVEDWHGRILNSSLPLWFNRMLINNNYVLSTNSILTKGNEFSMMETPADPVMGSLDRRLYSSIGPLLFVPNFEEGELMLFARDIDPKTPGSVYRRLGRGTPYEPTYGPSPAPPLDLNVKFALLVYRNYIMAGRRFILDHLFPRVRSAMEYVLAEDRDGDGLPELRGRPTMRDDWAVSGVSSYLSGLWLAAVRAYSKLARRLGHKSEAQRYDDLLVRALESFEQKLWFEEGGYYRFSFDPDAPDEEDRVNNACDAAQLAGQWYCDFLCLGQLFPPERVTRAMAAICRLNEQKYGVAHGAMPDGSPCPLPGSGMPDPAANVAWPNFDAGYYSSLMICHGYPDRGLFAVQKNFKNIHGRRGRAFNQPLAWDLSTNDAGGWGSDRHMASTSVWHVLYALLGFHLNVPDGVLWLRPHLPLNVYTVSAPLFTPICFGWLRFREDDENGYQQVVHLSFDGPIQLRTIVLRVPEGVEAVQILCESEDGVEQVDYIFGYDGKERLVEILSKAPIKVGNLLKLSLRQTAGQPFKFPRPAGKR